MLLKPAPDRVGLPDPRTMVRLPAEGRNIDLRGRDGAYWRRALRDGDVVDGLPKDAAPEAPKPAEPSPHPAASPSALSSVLAATLPHTAEPSHNGEHI